MPAAESRCNYLTRFDSEKHNSSLFHCLSAFTTQPAGLYEGGLFRTDNEYRKVIVTSDLMRTLSISYRFDLKIRSNDAAMSTFPESHSHGYAFSMYSLCYEFLWERERIILSWSKPCEGVFPTTVLNAPQTALFSQKKKKLYI